MAKSPAHDEPDHPIITPPPAKTEPVVVDHVKTVGEDQLERSQEMEREGVAAWMKAHSPHGPDEPAKAVAGVSSTEVHEHDNDRRGRR